MSAKARKKAKDLVRLALDERTPDKERERASRTVCKIIDKYNLLDSPLDDMLGGGNEKVAAAAQIFETLTDPGLVASVKTVSKLFRSQRRR